MTSVINGKSHQVIKFFKQQAAALEVYWVYCARASNRDNVAWPSLRGLANDTEFHKSTCGNARKWLVEHGALEPVENYIRPAWRGLSPKDLQQKLNFDKSEYYRPTGIIEIDGKTYSLLYNAPGEESDIKDSTDVLHGRPSAGTDIRPHRTEDNINKPKDTTKDQKLEPSNDGSNNQPLDKSKETKPSALAQAKSALGLLWGMPVDGDTSYYPRLTICAKHIIGQPHKNKVPGCYIPTLENIEETVKAFGVFYRSKYDDTTLPRDPSKFVEHWDQFITEYTAKKERKQQPAPVSAFEMMG